MIHITKSPYGRYCTVPEEELSSEEITRLDELLSIKKKGSEYSSAYKLGHWDGKIHMFRFNSYNKDYEFPMGALDDVRACLYASKIEVVDAPDSKRIYDLSQQCGFQWKTPKQLYDYQEEIIERVSNHGNCGVIEMPTGAGKTLTALKYAQQLDLPFMVLVHRAELFDQWRTEIRDVLGEEPVMIGDTASAKKIRAAIKRTEKENVKKVAEECKEKGIPFPPLSKYPYEADRITIIENAGDAREAIKNARCCIAMVQTLHSYMTDKKYRFYSLDVPVLIVDECHTCPADTVFDVIYRCSCKYTIGLSATVARNDGMERKITAIIGPRIKSVSAGELINREILATPKFYMLYPEPPEEYLNRFTYCTRPNYQTVYSDCIVEGENRNAMIAAVAEKFINEGGHQIYIHVSKIAHGEILCNMIPGAVFVSGNSKNRKQIIQDYRDGKITCLVSTLLKEGVSIPSIDILIYAAGGKSEVATIQTIGRVLRKKSDGRDAIVIDVYDAVDAYLLGHTKDRMKAYERFYENKFNPIYIADVSKIS